jgi:hypothetical protein
MILMVQVVILTLILIMEEIIEDLCNKEKENFKLDLFQHQEIIELNQIIFKQNHYII